MHAATGFEKLVRAHNAISDGLRIARACAFGLLHIDLLLERARLSLLYGDPDAALDDLRVALEDGVSANAQTGQPELLSATPPSVVTPGQSPTAVPCAEALLLKAAQSLCQESLGPAMGRELPVAVRELITQAASLLTQALGDWRALRDPSPNNANFLNPDDGIEYSFSARATHRILTKLADGVLTGYPLLHESRRDPIPLKPESHATPRFHVFLSHNSTDKAAIRHMKQQLTAYQLSAWVDEDELRPGVPWQELLEEGIKASASIAVLIGKDGLGPWEDEEMRSALRLAVTEKRPVIPVLLPDAPLTPALPMFLGNRTWVDLRGGLTKDGLERLVWGITGKRP